ncbi:hypothetical protein NIES4106_57740 (plasmid) [Fischerella sp. NIES-4106]|nr:hypothetical protein NIES4106_57740 [Fischerella sp. NIES-4106]
MSNSALLTNLDRSNKVVHLISHSDSPLLTQTTHHRQSHCQTKKSRRRGVVLTEQGRQKLVQAEVLYDDFSYRYTYEELSERSLLDSRTVSRILSCEVKVDKRTLKAFFCAFNLSLDTDDYASSKSDVVSKTTVNFAHYPSLSAATTKARLSVEELAELIPGMMQDLKRLLELLNFEQLR